MSTRKVFICGRGFLGANSLQVYLIVNLLFTAVCAGRHIARAIVASPQLNGKPFLEVQICSPWSFENLARYSVGQRLLQGSSFTRCICRHYRIQHNLKDAFKGASVVVSLVGVVPSSPTNFEKYSGNPKGAENVAVPSQGARVTLLDPLQCKLVLIQRASESHIPYTRTKGLTLEHFISVIQPEATVIRSSLVFGLEDDFFNVRHLFFRVSW